MSNLFKENIMFESHSIKSNHRVPESTSFCTCIQHHCFSSQCVLTPMSIFCIFDIYEVALIQVVPLDVYDGNLLWWPAEIVQWENTDLIIQRFRVRFQRLLAPGEKMAA
jgi:hypothetical protein